MKLLFTGASGFLGRNIADQLRQAYDVETLGRNQRNNFCFDLAREIPEFSGRFDIVLHAAGKAHSVPGNSEEAREFFNTNVEGTKNLCFALEKSELPEVIIFISTVAVYGAEEGEQINESHPLEGTSPYAQSKIQAEDYLINWCRLHNVKLGILRPSLIAGIDPPGNLGAMINGIESGKYLRIGTGATRKSILMAEDIAGIVPRLAETGGTYNVCDDYHPSFAELEDLICQQLNKRKPYSIPSRMARLIAYAGDFLGNSFPLNSDKLEKLQKTLTFSNERAKRDLNWQPKEVLRNFKIK